MYNRGVAKLPIFADTRDRVRFLRGLSEVVHCRSWTCLAYCLMGNHFHLVIGTPDADLDRGMQRLQGVYAQAFNRRHGRTGHLFHARYGATVLEDDDLTRPRYTVMTKFVTAWRSVRPPVEPVKPT